MSEPFIAQSLAIISLLVAGQGIGVLLLIMSSADRRSTADYLLVVYIALNCVCFFIEYFVYSHIPLPDYIGRVIYISLLEGPVFYLYVMALITPEFKLRPRHIIHGLPLLMIFLVSLFINSPDLIIHLILTIGYYLLLIIYLIACLLLLPDYEKLIRGNFSSIDNISLTWLYKLVIVYTLSSVLLLIMRLLDSVTFMQALPIQFISIPNTLIVFICFYYVVVGGYRQKTTADSLGKHDVQASVSLASKSKYKHSPIDKEESQQIRAKLNTYMEVHEPYLDHCLTLAQLAKGIGLSAYQLSQVLSTFSNQSFYDYINGYRAEKARQLIEASFDTTTPMIDIGLTAGFSNKTTFYKYFKSNFEKTPLQYKNALKHHNSMA